MSNAHRNEQPFATEPVSGVRRVTQPRVTMPPVVEQTVRPRFFVRLASLMFCVFLLAGALLMAAAHYLEAVYCVVPIMVTGFALVVADENGWSN